MFSKVQLKSLRIFAPSDIGGFFCFALVFIFCQLGGSFFFVGIREKRGRGGLRFLGVEHDSFASWSTCRVFFFFFYLEVPFIHLKNILCHHTKVNLLLQTRPIGLSIPTQSNQREKPYALINCFWVQQQKGIPKQDTICFLIIAIYEPRVMKCPMAYAYSLGLARL